MKFLLNVYTELPDSRPHHARFMAAAQGSGELVDGQALADPSTSAVVRVRDGVTTVTEGPYPASPVQLAAYYLVDCADRERALELAAAIPAAGCEAIEVRPVMRAAGMEM